MNWNKDKSWNYGILFSKNPTMNAKPNKFKKWPIKYVRESD